MKTFEQIADLEKRYLLGTYNRYPIALTRGKGVFLYDLEDRRYLDFVAGLGVNALGHAHPRIVKTIREQAGKLIHVSNLYYHEYQGALAEKLCTLLGSSFGNARAFFSNSGTEAIEGSIKLARLAGHRAGGEAKCVPNHATLTRNRNPGVRFDECLVLSALDPVIAWLPWFPNSGVVIAWLWMKLETARMAEGEF